MAFYYRQSHPGSQMPVFEPMGRGKRREKLALTLLWRIENISHWNPEYCKQIQSPHFEFLNAGTCHLCLCLEGEKEDDGKFACCLLFHNNIRSLDYEWSLLNGNGWPVVTRTIRNATMKFNEYVDFYHWPTYEDVFRVKKSSFLTNDTLILRCRFWNSNHDLEQAEYISGYTRITAAETSLLWRLKTFRCLQLGQELIFPFVLNFSEEQVTFKLKFSLKGNSFVDALMSFEIIQEDYNTCHRLTTTLFILLTEERTMKPFTYKTNFQIRDHPSEQVKRLPEYVLRQSVMRRKHEWLHNDDLTILCQFHSVKKQMENGINEMYKGFENLKEIPRSNPSISKFARIGTIIKESTCSERTPCNFELRSGDASIRVHKIVLITKSPVFRAIIYGKINEDSSFMYTDTLDHLDGESAAKLYNAADMYSKCKVQSLKQEWPHQLQSGTSGRNVSDILELADRRQDSDLELFVDDFLVSHSDVVIWSEEWETFLDINDMLAEKAMREVYKKKQEKDCN